MRPSSPTRFVLWFAVLVAALQLAYYRWLLPTDAFEVYMGGSAWLGARLLDVVGVETERAGTLLRAGTTAVVVKAGCDPVRPLIVLAAGVLAFPASVRRKLVGLLVGAAVIHLANGVRVASLLGLRLAYPEAFDWVHRRFWPVALVFLALCVWYVWARGVPPREEPEAAAAPAAHSGPGAA